MRTLEELAELLIEHGGKIVSTVSLSTQDIRQAQAGNRFYVNDNGFGFVWEPAVKIPTTPQEVRLFEQWYPLDEELPEHLKGGE